MASTPAAAAPAAAAAATLFEENVTKSGILHKKGGIRHNWLERWCELTTGDCGTAVLRYFECKSGSRTLKGKLVATHGQNLMFATVILLQLDQLGVHLLQ